MAHINDLMFAFFRGLGYTGALPDMRYEWLKDNGYASMRAAMAAEGFSSGSIADFMFSFFGNLFSPTSLFASNEEGAFYDFSNLATLRQNENGTGAAVDWGDPVGFVLDQSKGSSTLTDNLGAEEVTNGGFDDATGWTLTNGASISGGKLLFSTFAQTCTQSPAMDAGSFYIVSFEVSDYVSGQLNVRAGNFTYTQSVISGNGAYSIILLSSGNATVGLQSASTASFSVDNFSVRKLPGNHLTQSTSTARPLLARVPVGGRRNIEDASEAVAAKVSGATSGATRSGADITLTSAEGYAYIRTATTPPDSSAFVMSFEVISDTTVANVPFRAVAHNASGTAGSTLVNLTAGVPVRVSIPFTTGTGSNIAFGIDQRDAIVPGGADATGYTVTFDKLQLESGATATPYQKVTAAYDITESGKADVVGLLFDGVDDELASPSIDLASSEMTAAFGAQELKDSPNRTVLNHQSGSSRLWMYLDADDRAGLMMNAGVNVFRPVIDPSGAGTRAPYTAIGRANSATPITKHRVFGLENTSTSSLGGGTFGAAQFEVGDILANIFMSSALLVDRYITDEETTELETYLEDKAGVE
jgi:hypothetical protein